MTQKNKLDQLIRRVLKEEMSNLKIDIKEEEDDTQSTQQSEPINVTELVKNLTSEQKSQIAQLTKQLNVAQDEDAKGKIKSQIVDIVFNSINEDQVLVTPDGTINTATTDQKNQLKKAKPGQTVKTAKAGTGTVMESEEVPEGKDAPLDVQEGPCGACIAGSLTELMDKLKALGEGAKDSKHQRLAEKTMKYLEAAKTALESVVAHEAMLEEKDHAEASKGAEKDLKGIRKHLSKLVKDPETLDRIMKKMPIEKALELKKKSKGEMDEEKVAKAMLAAALREGVNLKKSLA